MSPASAAMVVEMRASNVGNVRRFVALIAGFDLAFWPSDAWVFREQPAIVEQFTAGRSIILAASVGLLMLTRTGVFRRAPVGIALVYAALLCGVVGHLLGQLGGPSTPWMHYTHIFPLAPLIVWLRPGVRMSSTLALALAGACGYFLADPGHLEDPLAASAGVYLSFVVVVSVLLGVHLDRLRARSFLLHRELAGHADLLARRVATQTASLRALATHLSATQENERAHLARELHDELGQDLTALRYALKVARLRYAATPTAIGGDLEGLADLLARTTAGVRQLLTGLRPRVLDDLGLAAALEWLAGRVEAVGLRCEVDVAGAERALPATVATTAFRVVQEALTNVMRHSAATRVVVRARCDDGVLEVEVVDDGVGCGAAPREGMGTLGMRERAAALAGELTITPALPRGTALRLRLPLAAAVEATS